VRYWRGYLSGASCK